MELLFALAVENGLDGLGIGLDWKPCAGNFDGHRLI